MSSDVPPGDPPEQVPAADPTILPVGCLGIVAPMNSLGFTPNPGIGVVYDEVIVLLPAQALVFTFQRKHAVEAARSLPYDEAARRRGVRVYKLRDVIRAELTRPVAGYRLVLELAGVQQQRWIVQSDAAAEVKRCLTEVLGDRFVDSTGTDGLKGWA